MSLSRLFNDSLTGFPEFVRLFDEFNNSVASQNQAGKESNTSLRPRMNIHEDAKTNTIAATFELPGVRKEDIHVDVHNGRLSISGESRAESEHEKDGYLVRERRFGKFARSLQLPQGVKENDIRASMENGILTVSFPRNAPEAQPKSITVN